MSRNRFSLFLFCLLFLAPVQVCFSQSFNFRNYTVDDGLPFVGVTAIYQDTKGNLWSGGYGGLSKFNGKNFTNYSPKNGLVNHRVLSISGDSLDRIWIGTLTGLSCFHNGEFTTYNQKSGLPDDKINCLFTDYHGILWAGTPRGVGYLSGNHFIVPDHLLDSVDQVVTCFYEDKRKNLWIGTDKGIAIRQSEKGIPVRILNKQTGLNDNHVNSIFQDRAGNYWVGTDKGLTRYDKDIKNNSSAAALNGINVNAVIQDIEGNIWISTELGLWKYDGREFKLVSLGHDVNANKTSCLFQDFEHNIWVGTYSGLFRYRSSDFLSYGSSEGLTSPFVSQLCKDKSGNLWVATNGGGINIFRDGRFINYTEAEGLPSNNISSIIQARDGRMWVGTDHGFCTCQPVTDPLHKPRFKPVVLKTALPSDSINIIYQDRKGRIWMGANNGVVLCEGSEFKWMSMPHEKNTFSVYYFMEDQQGDVWIGTYMGGLFRFDGQNIVKMNKELGLENESSFLAMLQDKKGIYYFGTFGGVYVVDLSRKYIQDGKAVQYSESDGMSSDLVYSMTFDEEEETLWVGTNQALNKIDLGAFRHSGRKLVVPYGKEEGFNGVECNGSAICTESNGSIWFGTVNGLIRYNPLSYKPNKAQTKTSITGVRLFYTDTLLASGAEMAYDQNNISFEYIGICLTNPKKVRYKVKLEGFDKTWSPVTVNNIATYSNLPPGHYSFRVMSCNNERVWSSGPIGLNFTILAPFWKRWWFSTLLSILLISLAVVYFRYRISQVREKENMKVRMATNELKALRSQMNPHFIFNSLNSIQHFIVSNDEVSASKYLNTFAKLIRTILTNSERATASIREEIDSLRLYLQLEGLRFENKFDYKITIDPSLDIDYHEVPTMLIQPFAENAILHGLLPKQGNGILDITIFKQGDFILCCITDNGIGRKKALELKGDSLRKTHKSFGLKITQDRLELLNTLQKSSLNVKIVDLVDEAGMGCGTRVEIYIPVF
jgi:ligand-binding sensor domain-containing protein